MKKLNEQQDNVEKGVNLFEYLKQLSLLNSRTRKNVKEIKESRNEEECLDLEDDTIIPILDNIFCRHRDPQSELPNDLLISVKRYKIEKPPKLPKEIEKWVDYDSISLDKEPQPNEYITYDEQFSDSKDRRNTWEEIDAQEGNFSEENTPECLRGWVTKDPTTNRYTKIENRTIQVYFKDFPELEHLYDDWLNFKWKGWQQKNYKFFLSNKVYDKFRSLRSFLKTEGDSYDLLWGHDILSWKVGDEEIYYPILFTPIVIELDTEKSIINIKSDENTSTFFDIAFIRELLSEDSSTLSDIDNLIERMTSSIKKGEFDVWDYEAVHKYFERLVRYIQSDGSSLYNDRGQKIKPSKDPVFLNTHHLFLLKKSGRSWATYSKKIQDDILENGTLTPFLKDLIFDNLGEQDSDADFKNEQDISDTELYFPLPYNKEQKKIANQIDSSYGAVVQGPPGTGKTHTIANLISRYLALGKTILVTAQTSQSLSVLKEKIPKGIRSMTVSQIESTAGNEDLQESVSQINTILSDKMIYTEGERQRILYDLKEVRKRIATKNSQLQRKALIDSQESIVIDGERISPMEAAKFVGSLNKDKKELQISDKDKIDFNQKIAITQEQIDEYVSLLGSSKEIMGFSGMDDIPHLEELPTIENFIELFETKEKLGENELDLDKYNLPSEEDIKNVLTVKDRIEKYFSQADKFYQFLEQEKGTNATHNIDFNSINSSNEDDMYQKAKQLVVKERRASNELLTESLGIDYTRATMLLNLLTENGIIGPINKATKKYNQYDNTTHMYFEYTNINQKYDQHNIDDMYSRLQNVKFQLNNFNEDWQKEIYRTLKNSSERKKWTDILERINTLIIQYREEETNHLGDEIIIDTNYNISQYLKLLDALDSLIDKNKSDEDQFKKGLKYFFSSTAKDLIKNIKINNHEPITQGDLRGIKYFFLCKKNEDEIKRLWQQAFSNISTSYPSIEDFKIVNVENFMKHVEQILSLTNNAEDISKDIINLGIIKNVSLLTDKDIKDVLDLVESIIAVFKKQQTLIHIENLVKKLQQKNAHPATTSFIQAIKENNIAKIDDLSIELRRLIQQSKISSSYHSLRKDIDKKFIHPLKQNKNNHEAVIQFIEDIESSDIESIKFFYQQIPTLIEQQNQVRSIREMEDVLNKFIPQTISEIKLKTEQDITIAIDIKKSWKFKRLVSWLDSIHSGDDLSKINKDLLILKNQEKELVTKLVEISAWQHLRKRVDKKQKESLSSFALSMKKRGKGTGKYARKHLEDAKNSLNNAKSAVPVWIMPINMVSELFAEPKSSMFDIVIFDEASQIDARGLNVAYIGKKLLVVGDDEQVSPTSFTNQQKVNDLINLHISDIPNKQHFSSTSSLFDIAKIKMTDAITLTEHFRSISEIIGFSNSLSYDGKLNILRDQLPTYRLEPVLEPIYVKDGYEETNGQINQPEAESVVQKIKHIIGDEQYSTTDESGQSRPISIGVISLLGKDQSKLITKIISEQIAQEEIEKRQIICGDPYVFQGDERDIILLSMVKAPDLYDPSKPIMPYTISNKSYKQRINVAMSRARNKMILFHSIHKNQLSNPDDLRKRIIDWFYNNIPESRKAGLSAVRKEVDIGHASEFEYEVAEILINKGYKEVIPQYEVAGYRIDLVVQGNKSKLAIECDGDKYHNHIEKWREDIERQQILERAGWQFWRLAGSAFYRNKEKSLDSLWKKLDELGIKTYQEIEEKEFDKTKEDMSEVVAHTEEEVIGLDIDENIKSDDTEHERADIDDTSETNSEFVLVRESPNKTKKYVADLVSTQGYSNVEFIDSVLDKKVFRTKTHFEALLYLEQLLKGNPELDIKIAKISVDSGIVQVVED